MRDLRSFHLAACLAMLRAVDAAFCPAGVSSAGVLPRPPPLCTLRPGPGACVGVWHRGAASGARTLVRGAPLDFDDDDVFYGDLDALSSAAPAASAPALPSSEGDAFRRLGLDAAVAHAAAMQGWHAPTDVQHRAIPPMLAGRDMWVEAETGSGKTAAFALPLLQSLCVNPRPRVGAGARHAQALVLSPTRELAMQTARVLTLLARYVCKSAEGKAGAGAARDSLQIRVVYGGVPVDTQLDELRQGVDVLVATPGRLLDVIMREESQGGGGGGRSVAWLSLGETRILVLDEADRLLSPAFAGEMEMLLERLPRVRLDGNDAGGDAASEEPGVSAGRAEGAVVAGGGGGGRE